MPNEIPTANLTIETTKELTKHFNDFILKFSKASKEVVGYHISYNSPLELQNILGVGFHRNFVLTLQNEINSIKTAEEIDKKKLHAALLYKYLGIKSDVVPLSIDIHPNAYLSACSNNDDNADKLLHLYFLQPYRLFGIAPNGRKFTGNDVKKRDWHFSGGNSANMAEVFRQLVQIYLISSIIDDYANNEVEFYDPQIAKQLDSLEKLRLNLLTNALRSFEAELSQLAPLSALNGDPYDITIAALFLRFLGIRERNDPEAAHNFVRGMRSSANWLDNLFPGFMNIASFYSVGRFFLGQAIQDPYVEVAARASQKGGKLYFLWKLLLAHFNWSTSLYWLQHSLKAPSRIWKQIKEIIQMPHVSRNHLKDVFVRQVLPTLLINIFVFLFSPLFVLGPAIFGLTSLPLTLIRLAIFHSPFKIFRHYNALNILDLINIAKDWFIFTTLSAVLLNTSLTAMLLAPLALIGPGILISLSANCGLILKSAFDLGWQNLIVQNSTWIYPHLIEFVIYSQIGIFILTSVTLTAIIGIAIHHLNERYNQHPDRVNYFLNKIQTIFAPLEKFSSALRSVITGELWLKKSQLSKEKELASFQLPTFTLFTPSVEATNKIAQLQRRLRAITQAFNLSSALKDKTKSNLQALEITPDTTEASLTQSINTAEALVDALAVNTFTTEEVQLMRKLCTLLVSPTEMQSDKTALRAAINNGVYLPSGEMANLMASKTSMQWTKDLKEAASKEEDSKELSTTPDETLNEQLAHILEKCSHQAKYYI